MSVGTTPGERRSIPGRLGALQNRIDDGLALITSRGFRMPELTLADRLDSPGYSRLLELVALGDDVAVALATRRFTYTIHMLPADAARRHAYDMALSLLVDTALHLVRPATIVLDRGRGEGVRPGGVHLSIDRWSGGEVIATIVTDFADVVPREGLNSALLSLASWWTIPTAAPYKPIFRKTWPNPDTAGPGTGDSSAIAAAISLAVVQVLDAVGEAPVVLRHTVAEHPFVDRMPAALVRYIAPSADRSIARDIVRVPRPVWKVPHPAEIDPRGETEAVQGEVARALQLANDADDEVSLMALDDIARHLTERRTYESELVDWLRIMAEQRTALVALAALNRTLTSPPSTDQEEDDR